MRRAGFGFLRRLCLRLALGFGELVHCAQDLLLPSLQSQQTSIQFVDLLGSVQRVDRQQVDLAFKAPSLSRSGRRTSVVHFDGSFQLLAIASCVAHGLPHIWRRAAAVISHRRLQPERLTIMVGRRLEALLTRLSRLFCSLPLANGRAGFSGCCLA
ncbi:hypothetical protein CE206_29065 (plasmid) [Achromobacter xylosoxidans]|nr:hypothetical protein CE206_29065 [Achromobacter xylosoxidans]